MPQVLGLVLIGAGLIAGFKALQAVAGRVSDELQRAADAAQRHRTETEANEESVGAKDLGTLEFDPAAGVYKPRHG